MKNLRNELEVLKGKYTKLRDEKIEILADSNMSKLMNLLNEFDDTFDTFFDQEDLRKKYNDYDFENEEIIFEKGQITLEEQLDDIDLQQLIICYENSIGILQDEIDELNQDN